MLVDEGLRMDTHPGVFFREGPAGRRAVVAGGPDVWEVIGAITSLKATQPNLSPDEVVATVSEEAGVPARVIAIAVDYYASYPDEIDVLVADNERAEKEMAIAAARRSDLLGA